MIPPSVSRRHLPPPLSVPAKPGPLAMPASRTAVLAVNTRCDSCVGGGSAPDHDDDDAQAGRQRGCVEGCARVLDVARGIGVPVIHTQRVLPGTGATGSLQHRQLPGAVPHGLVPMLDELVVEHPGKSPFWNTPLMDELVAMGITHLVIVGGMGGDVVVGAVAEEARERGFVCCKLHLVKGAWKDGMANDLLLGKKRYRGGACQ